MEPPNKDRVIVSTVRSICTDLELRFESFSHDWILRISDQQQTRNIFGYHFDLNSAASALIAKDKSATSDCLEQAEVPHIEHKLFLHPSMTEYLGHHGNWQTAIEYAEAHHHQLVCKDNQGTGGNGILKITDQRSLEEAFQQMYSSGNALCLSPFCSISAEYRVILLDDTPLLTYEKKSPSVTGDGIHSYEKLLFDTFGNHPNIYLQACEDAVHQLDFVPEPDEVLKILWKNNLGKGNFPKSIYDETLKKELHLIANKARKAIGARFVSVDLVKTGNDLRVLEINGGIMLENYSRLADDGVETAKSIYKKAVEEMFA